MATSPVISFSLAGLEKHPGFRLTLPMLHGMLYGVLYGDLLMALVNQCKPYELEKGQAQAPGRRLAQPAWARELGSGGKIRLPPRPGRITAES